MSIKPLFKIVMFFSIVITVSISNISYSQDKEERRFSES